MQFFNFFFMTIKWCLTLSISFLLIDQIVCLIFWREGLDWRLWRCWAQQKCSWADARLLYRGARSRHCYSRAWGFSERKIICFYHHAHEQDGAVFGSPCGHPWGLSSCRHFVLTTQVIWCKNFNIIWSESFMKDDISLYRLILPVDAQYFSVK